MTWRTIPDTEVDTDSPVTTTLMTALRDNPIAIANADSGATEVVFDAIRTGVAGITAGAVGTWCLAVDSNPDGAIAFGSTTAGSNLVPGCYYEGNVTGNGLISSGSSVSGTWRCLGRGHDDGSDSTNKNLTMWIRIS